MRRVVPPALLAGLVLALGACADEEQDIFTPEGDKAEKINDLQVPVFVVAGVVGVLVFAALAYVCWVGVKRRKAGAEDPVQLEGNFKLEIGWTIAPAVLLAVISVFTVATLFELDDAEAGELGELEITVYGQQWWWAYEYDIDADGEPEVVTANDLVLPVDTDVTVNIESRDVIHSFWIPALNGTRDAVPGRVHTLVFHADEPGIYEGQCKEYCGLSHANMRQRAVVVTMPEFATWLEQQQDTQPVLEEGDPGFAGQELFVGRCSSCHQINGVNEVEGSANVVARYAPNLTHLMTRGVFAGGMFDLYDPETGEFDRAKLEAWLRNPPGAKDMYVPAEGIPRGMPDLALTEEEIDQLVDYLVTLHPQDTDRPPLTTSSETDDE